MLKECQGEIMSINSSKGSIFNHFFTVNFLSIEFEKTPIPSAKDTVTIKMYVTNLPFFKRQSSINIEGYHFDVFHTMKGVLQITSK